MYRLILQVSKSAYLPCLIQFNRERYGRDDEDAGCVHVVIIHTPQDDAADLEYVKRIQDLK